MSTEAVSIITNAEYLALFKNGRNNHRIDNILTQIYFLCSIERLEQAKELVDKLYVAIYDYKEKTLA